MDSAALVVLASVAGFGFDWHELPDEPTAHECVVQIDRDQLALLADSRSMPLVVDVPESIEHVRRIRVVVTDDPTAATRREVRLKPAEDQAVLLAQHTTPARYGTPRYPGQPGTDSNAATAVPSDPYAKQLAPGVPRAHQSARGVNPSSGAARPAGQVTSTNVVNPFDNRAATAANTAQSNGLGAQSGGYGQGRGLGDRLDESVQRATAPVREGIERVDNRVRSAVQNVGDQTEQLLDKLGRPLANRPRVFNRNANAGASGQPGSQNFNGYGGQNAASSGSDPFVKYPNSDGNTSVVGQGSLPNTNGQYSQASVGGSATRVNGNGYDAAGYAGTQGMQSNAQQRALGNRFSSTASGSSYDANSANNQSMLVRQPAGNSPLDRMRQPGDNVGRTPPANSANPPGRYQFPANGSQRPSNTTQSSYGADQWTSTPGYRTPYAGQQPGNANSPNHPQYGSQRGNGAANTQSAGQYSYGASLPYGARGQQRPYAQSPGQRLSPGVGLGSLVFGKLGKWLGSDEGTRVAANPYDQPTGPRFPEFPNNANSPTTPTAGDAGDFEPFVGTGGGTERAPAINSSMLRRPARARLEGGVAQTTPVSNPIVDVSRQQLINQAADDPLTGDENRLTQQRANQYAAVAQDELRSSNLGAVLAAWVLLCGSIAGNLYLFWSYLDVRAKFQMLSRQDFRAARRNAQAA